MMDKQSWIGRLLGRKPVEKSTPQPSHPTKQASVPLRKGDVTEIASYEQVPQSTAPVTSAPSSAVAPASVGEDEGAVPAVWRMGTLDGTPRQWPCCVAQRPALSAAHHPGPRLQFGKRGDRVDEVIVQWPDSGRRGDPIAQLVAQEGAQLAA